ncbi:MAG: hypothetical protein V7609_2376 [Verrucomicrobiota bacterium]
MEFVQAHLLLDHPAARLLRLPTAAFVLAFLDEAFHAMANAAVAEDSLRMRLERWLDERRADESFTWERTATAYLDEWCSDACGWLRKTTAPKGVSYELTPASEKALRWLEDLQGTTAFVGTESRMEGIFRELGELLLQASGDKEARLAELQAQRDRLDTEITEILTTGQVRTLEPWQVNERYARVLEAARSLVSDFRQVEENFRRIAEQIVKEQTGQDERKGEILGRALDSHDSVRESPQGRSFYGFVMLLLDPERRERFETQVAEALRLPALSPTLSADPLLPRLLPRLRIEQEKVSASTQRLTANLRRALESTRLAERRRVRELVSEIQRLALRVKDAPPRRESFFEISELTGAYAGMSRPLWDEGATIELSKVFAQADGELDLEKLLAFQNLPHLSLDTAIHNLETCLRAQELVLLTSVLETFPPAHGLLEVLGYLILAAREPRRHYISRDFDVITLPDGARWRLPRVVFGRRSLDEAA